MDRSRRTSTNFKDIVAQFFGFINFKSDTYFAAWVFIPFYYRLFARGNIIRCYLFIMHCVKRFE